MAGPKKGTKQMAALEPDVSSAAPSLSAASKLS
jgi:hypothetical protein